MDIDMFQDIRIRKLIRHQGGKAVTVYTLLLCLIYRDGYYMKWDQELPFIISEQTGYDVAYIGEVVRCCVMLGLFHAELFQKGILTSQAIQRRYSLICELSRRAYDIKDYCLISVQEPHVSAQECMVSVQEPQVSAQECRVSVQEPTVSVQEPTVSSEKTPQRKEKERKASSTSPAREAVVVSKMEITSGKEPVRKEVDNLKASPIWLAQVAMRFRQTEADICSALDDFLLDCLARGTTSHSGGRNDVQKHFCDWYRIKLNANQKSNDGREKRRSNRGCSAAEEFTSAF